MKFISKYVSLIIAVFILLNCGDDTIDTGIEPELGPQESSITYKVLNYPDIGSTETIFDFYPAEISDLTNLNLLKFRYDFDNDGNYDTDWIDTSKITHQYTTAGKKDIKVELKDDKGDYKYFELTVYVGRLEKVKGPDPAVTINEPSFAKDGTNRIVYDSYSESGHQLFIADLDTETATQLTFYDGSDGNNCKHVPDWSPDGSTIAVDHKDGTYLVDAVTGDLTKFSSLNPVYLEYSPDGEKIILISGVEDGTYIIDVETKTESKFSERQNGVAWSPDGSQIAEFDYYAKQINILNVNDGSIVKSYGDANIQRKGDRANFLDWSADGKWIYICHYHSLLNLDSGKFYTISSGKFKRDALAEGAMNKEMTMIAFTNSKEDDPVDPIYLLRLPTELKD